MTTTLTEEIKSLSDLLPEYVLYNEAGEVHHAEIPALMFQDGEHHYYYRGVYIPHEIFDKLLNKKIQFDDWVKQDNEELKSSILAYIGDNHGSEDLFRFISSELSEVDTYVDKKEEKYLVGTTLGMNIGVYSLFKGDKEYKGVKLSFTRCYCPSTDRMFFLGVHESYDNAKDAIASLYKIPKKLRNHIKYICRQGERFSTTLTDEGKKIVKTLTETDLKDTTTISGDEYFSLMRYEY